MRYGSIRIFRLLGIDVSLHWSWFILAALIVPQLVMFSSTAWRLLAFVSLFIIATLHEFGHALGCRSVGGMARHILLSPLGGAAMMSPPARPGAVMWAVAAGPLVNVLLIPVTAGAYLAVRGGLGWPQSGNDVQLFWFAVMAVNAGLLVFNLVPVFPLDGGQLLMAALWFVVGLRGALSIVVWTGPAAAAALALLAIATAQPLLLLVSAFFALQAWKGYHVARAMRTIGEADQDDGRDSAVPPGDTQRSRVGLDPWQ